MHDCIVQEGLEPRDFVWRIHSVPREGEREPEIVHEPSGFLFRFLAAETGHACKFSPGHQHEFNYANGLTWDYLMSVVRTWLRNLKREISVLDPWAEFEILSSTPTAMNLGNPEAHFTSDEIKIVHAQLDSLEAEMERLQLGSSVERQAIRKAFEDLKTAAERIGKKDWRLVFVGTMASMVLEKVVSSGTMRSLWTLIDSAFHKIVGLLAAG